MNYQNSVMADKKYPEILWDLR